MDNTITNRQMVFILFLTLTSITIITIPKTIAEKAGVGGWATLLLTALMFGLLVMVIASLNSMYRGKMLYDYSRELLGKAFAVIFAVFYSLYFLMVSAYLCTSMASMLKANFLLETPLWAFVLVSLPVFGYVAYKGVTNIARLFEFYGVIFILAMTVVHGVMLYQGETDNIRPLFVPSETGKYLAAVKDTIIGFLGIEVLTITPFSLKRSKKAPRVAFLTLIAVGFAYVLVVETSIMMVGIHEITFYEYPLINAIRQIVLHYIEFLRRVDIVYLTLGVMGIVAGISMVYLAIVEYVCRLFPRAARWLVVVIVGFAIFLLSLEGFGILDFRHIAVQLITYGGLLAAGVIPVSLWIVAKVKRHG